MPEFIAAVIPTTRRSRLHSATSASPKTAVYCGGGTGRIAGGAGAAIPFAIEFGFAACQRSMPSRPPSSAGAKPLPFTVATWTTTGRPAANALRSARRRARTSWPSMTPTYAQSSSSQNRPGAQNALIDSLSCGPRRSKAGPMPGRSVRRSSTDSRVCQSFGFSRTRLK